MYIVCVYAYIYTHIYVYYNCIYLYIYRVVVLLCSVVVYVCLYYLLLSCPSGPSATFEKLERDQRLRINKGVG